MTLLILAILAIGQADPNALRDFASHWLEPVAWTERVYYVPSETDPNNMSLLAKVTQRRVVHRLDLTDFVFLAQRWPGDPNAVFPDVGKIEPNQPTMPQDVNEPEPNEVQAKTVFCFTVGGRDHLYEDCRYIKDKEYKPCLCEDGNLCLTCVNRKLNQ